jgi:DNA-binding winged helix-turn-helix (wHTH) protein
MPTRVVSTDRLMDAVWSGEESEFEVGTLRYHISKLRDSLEGGESSRTDGAIATRSPGYVLEVEADLHDAIHFERLVDEARQLRPTDPSGAMRLLDHLGYRRRPQ